MSLANYLNNKWIHRHESSLDEIRRLLAVADRDIQQSQTTGLGPEWRFDIAYQLGTAISRGGLGGSWLPGRTPE